MKKLNKTKIVTLIFICFFVVNINAFAKCEDYNIVPTEDSSALKEAEQKCNSAEEDGYKCQWYQENLESGNGISMAPIAWCVRTDEKYNNKVTVTDTASLGCSSWGDLKNDIQNVFNFLKVVVPLLVIGLSTYDFIKAVAAKDNKDVKKAFQRLLKRFLYAILLFFLPVLINFLLDLAGTNVKICEWMS